MSVCMCACECLNGSILFIFGIHIDVHRGLVPRYEHSNSKMGPKIHNGDFLKKLLLTI
jgi:hypothetical protein